MQNVKCKMGERIMGMYIVIIMNYKNFQGLISILSANCENLSLRGEEFARAKCYVYEK
jgi:hypothetical protein